MLIEVFIRLYVGVASSWVDCTIGHLLCGLFWERKIIQPRPVVTESCREHKIEIHSGLTLTEGGPNIPRELASVEVGNETEVFRDKERLQGTPNSVAQFQWSARLDDP